MIHSEIRQVKDPVSQGFDKRIVTSLKKSILALRFCLQSFKFQLLKSDFRGNSESWNSNLHNE